MPPFVGEAMKACLAPPATTFVFTFGGKLLFELTVDSRFPLALLLLLRALYGLGKLGMPLPGFALCERPRPALDSLQCSQRRIHGPALPFACPPERL